MKTILPAIALFAIMAAGATSANAAYYSSAWGYRTSAPARTYVAPGVCNTCAPRVAYVAMENRCVTCNPCDPCGRGWSIFPWNW